MDLVSEGGGEGDNVGVEDDDEGGGGGGWGKTNLKSHTDDDGAFPPQRCLGLNLDSYFRTPSGTPSGTLMAGLQQVPTRGGCAWANVTNAGIYEANKGLRDVIAYLIAAQLASLTRVARG